VRHFNGLVAEGTLPNWQLRIDRDGEVAFSAYGGWHEVEAAMPLRPDTVWRWYSLSKPVMTAAALSLVEDGALELSMPVADVLPEFRDMQVYVSGEADELATRPATEPVRIWHLLTNTAGLTYGFLWAHPVDALYRRAGFVMGHPPGSDLAEVCARLARLPLLFEPGTAWNYSMAIDVLAHVAEVATDQPLRALLAERVFDPLGMFDTGFRRPADDDRVAGVYRRAPDGVLTRDVEAAAASDRTHGPGGLRGTIDDYCRFSSSLHSHQLLQPSTVQAMVTNQLPGRQRLDEFGRPLYPSTSLAGIGFGFGVAIVEDPTAAGLHGSPGEYYWTGAGGAQFWNDPRHHLSVVFFTHRTGAPTPQLRSELHQLVYQAIA
jgi:CubicO group peptidase (beta-lactamase class C family)